MGGKIVSMTRYTMAHIGGTRLKYLLYIRWDKRRIRFGYRRIFMDVNPDFVWEVVDLQDDKKDHIYSKYPGKYMCMK